MKNWIYILMIGLMGSLVSSCQQALDEEVQLPETAGKAQITFTIALDNIDSRAVWSENESATDAVAGLADKNQIDLSMEDGLQVFVYDLQGNLLSEVTDKEVRKIDSRTYRFNGQLEITGFQGSTLECRLMVYANCIDSRTTFSYDAPYIPMWGVKKATLQLAKGELTQLAEPIYLLRAMAKVEVLVADGVGKLESVMVDKYNEKGNVLPTGAAGATATDAMDDQAVFNPNTTTLGTDLEFLSDGNGGFYIYLPEYQNVGAASPAQMGVVIDGETYPLEFKKYSDGTLFNIVRNHYYQYIITGVVTQEDAEVALSYDVIVGAPQEVIVPSFE